jgi:hypothetical protein
MEQAARPQKPASHQEDSMRKALWFGVVIAMLSIVPARAQSLTFFFSSAFLDPLARGPTVLNLTAQTANKVAQADVNAFNDFYLINGVGRLKVRFNQQLQNLGQVTLPGWIGVAQYSNREIFYDLQFGFQQVKANYNIPNARAGHVTIYKTLNTAQLVYDYAVQIGPTLCQEYLFTPATGGFQLGFRVNCFQTLGNVRGKFSAGRLGRT